MLFLNTFAKEKMKKNTHLSQLLKKRADPRVKLNPAGKFSITVFLSSER